MDWDELEKSLHELGDFQGYQALQFLFWRAYESKDNELYMLLKQSIEYGLSR